MEDLKVKLEVFENSLWASYLEVQNDEHTYWVSLHKVMNKIGLPLDIFNERLK
jgi:hypothetical protein